MSSLNVTIIGDSIVSNSINKKKISWANELMNIVRRYNKCRIRVKLLSKIGINSRGLLNEIPDFFLKIKLKNILIIQIGINDSWHYKSLKGVANVSIISFQKNLIEIIDKSRIYGFKKIYFLNYHKLYNNRIEGNKKTIDQNLNKYNSKIKQICKQKNLKLININKYTKKRNLKITSRDKIHLNQKGAKFYANIIFRELLKNKELPNV
jgi:lysophospholipase L1-like esterase